MPDINDAPDLDATVPVAGPTPSAGSSPRLTVNLPLPEDLAKLLPEGTYTVESFLGQGGMGAVYRGTQVRLQRQVAIKIMCRDQGRDHGFEERFRREALALAQLNHPNIVNVIDYGEAGPDYLYIVMEFVDGTDLVGVIRSGQMTQESALKLLPQICDALQFAHDNGIVHRDIKPANILLTRDGRIKMADFGLAKRFDVNSTFQTQTGAGMGTPDYAAPEQFDPNGNVDHRADIYALGVMIYQMVTGQLPRGAWKPPSEKADVDAHWDKIVSHALQTDPSDRYASVSEIKTDISSITAASGGLGGVTGSAASRKSGFSGKLEGSTTALTQAGGRSVSQTRTLASEGDVQPTKSRRSRVPVLMVAALVVFAVGGYLGWREFKTTKVGSTPLTSVAASYPRPKFWVDATQELRDLVLKNNAGKVNGEWLHTLKPSGYSLGGSRLFRDVAMRVTMKGAATILLRRRDKTESVQNYSGELTPAGHALLYQWDAKRFQKIGFKELSSPLDSYDPLAEHEFMVVARGDEISLWLDGRLVLSQQDNSLDEGYIALNWFNSNPDTAQATRIKKVEYADLGGTVAAASQSAVSRTWQAPTLTVAADTEWTNLIPHIKPERDVIRGGWTVDENGLTAKRAEWAICNIPVQDPGTDYDLRYKVTRGEGSHLAMFFAFRKGSTGGYVPIDYINDKDPAFADGQRWATLEDLTHLDMRDDATVKAKRKEWLPRGKACTVLLQVREKEVTVSVNDEEAFRWPAEWSKLQQRGGAGGSMFLDVTGGPIFGVGIFNCEAVFQSIEMRRVGEPKAAASASTPTTATKEAPFENTLGMKFVPVPITGGPTDGKIVLFSVWETRVQDYEAFVKATKRTWAKPGFVQEPVHPAVMVSIEEARLFCSWLTERERGAGKLGPHETYRLPTDHEWSCAVGIGDKESATMTPREKNNKLSDLFPWGSTWPPPANSGNFWSEELRPLLTTKTFLLVRGELSGYLDGHATTAPVGSYAANAMGLHDLGGNVWEWCADWMDGEQKEWVLRGASWAYNGRVAMLSSGRSPGTPGAFADSHGFRCVLVPSEGN